MLHRSIHERVESSYFGRCWNGKHCHYHDGFCRFLRNEWCSRNSHIVGNRCCHLEWGLNQKPCNYILESWPHHNFPRILAHHSHLDEDRLNFDRFRSGSLDFSLCKRIHSRPNSRIAHASSIRLRDALSQRLSTISHPNGDTICEYSPTHRMVLPTYCKAGDGNWRSLPSYMHYLLEQLPCSRHLHNFN